MIPVGVGGEVSKRDLENATPLKENIIQVPKTETPKDLAQKIIDKIRGAGGEIRIHYVACTFLFHLFLSA